MIFKLNRTTPSPPPPDPAPGLEQRLLAEAVRLHEDAQGFALSDPRAETAARNAGGGFERRLIARAQALTVAPTLATALHQLRGAFGWIVAIGLVLALVSGATAARVALGAELDRPFVNFFWLLGSLLGVPTLALLIWLAMLFTQPAALASGSLGGLAFLLGRRLDRWLHKGPIHVAAVQALGTVYTRTPIGRWTLSAVSHALWLAFLSGCLVLVVLILSTRQYNFAWETTILSDDAYIFLTRAIAALPEALGFTTPSAEQIIASHWTGGGEPPGGYREAWSGLLVGSLVVYGLVPRTLLLAFCLAARWRAARRFRLDTTLPGYARLQNRLLPPAQSMGVIDADVHRAPPPPAAPVSAQPEPIQASGPAAILGLEIDPPATWPPPVNGLDWLDLGFVDSRDDRHRALDQVRALPLRAVAVVCSVATTPDRGTRGFLGELRQASPVPLVMILTDGQRLRERGHGDEVEQRFADWRALAEGAQVPAERVVDADLEHLTDASRARLATLLGVENSGAAPARRIEQAFALILEHARSWPGEPEANAQAELHRAIARLYHHAQGERQPWQALLQTPLKTGTDLLAPLQSGAQRMVSLLPERLRKNPRWYAAGALAGAMGCVAAATLVAPVAIASLPLWAGLGAALAAVVPAKERPAAADSPEVEEGDLADAVTGAALFALLLELQGRDEVAITRIIDRVAGDGAPPPIRDGEAARRWLDTLRHRFDLAQTAERSP